MSHIDINLLPLQYRKKKVRLDKVFGRRVVWPTVALLVILVAGLSYKMKLGMELDEVNGEIRRVEETIKSKQGLLAEIKQLEADRAIIDRKNAALRSIQVSRQRWIVTFENIAYVLPDNTWLISMQERGGGLELTAVTFQFAEVAQYMSELQKQVAVSSVTLKKIRTVKVARAQAFEFGLQIGLVQDVGAVAQGK